MVEIWPQLLHPGQGIADRLGELRLARDLRKLGMQPGFEIVEDRHGVGLPELHPRIGQVAPGLLLDTVEPGDPLDGFLGDDQALGLEDISELAPDMRQACDYGYAAASIKLLEAGIAVGVHPARVGCEMLCRMLAFSIGSKSIPGRR